jgi:DNA polymerase III sliding clamp (beta) subunit (PCNA family)
MQFSINRKSLQDALKYLVPAVPSKKYGTRLITFEVRGHTVALTVGSYSLQVSTALITLDPDQDGSFTLDWDQLRKTDLGKGVLVYFVQSGDAVKVNEFPLATVERYSELRPVIDSTDRAFTVDASNYQAILKDVLYAVYPTDDQPKFRVIRHEVQNHQLTLKATDRYRLAISRSVAALSQSDCVFSMPKIDPRLFPVAGTLYIEYLDEEKEYPDWAKKPKGETYIDRTIQIRTRDTRIMISSTDHEYPDYSAVIPAATGHAVTVDRAALIAALTGVKAGIEGDSDYPVTLRWHDDTLTLNDTTSVTGITVRGEPDPVRLSASYLLDALKTSNDPHVTLELWHAPDRDTVIENFPPLPDGVTIKGTGDGFYLDYWDRPELKSAVDDWLKGCPVWHHNYWQYATIDYSDNFNLKLVRVGPGHHYINPLFWGR